MLDDFLVSNREPIIALTMERMASRMAKSSGSKLADGIPVFLDQLGVALRLARSSTEINHEDIRHSAGRHGSDLMRMGLTIEQVVHCYGDVCQAVTELAVQQGSPMTGQEFQTLNLCLDDAIAQAVTEFASLREGKIQMQGSERLGMLAHELRNLITTAMLSFESIKGGRVAVGGSTGLLLGSSLMGLRDLIDRSLADVRLDAGIEHLTQISVAEFIEEVEIAASIQALARGVHFEIGSVDRTLIVAGDRPTLAAALSNLLQNAFKFTREHGNVSLFTRSTSDRVLFEVEDECGGLPPGKAEDLFRPFEQAGADRSGVGLGLSICLKAAKANGGELRVRDVPGKGCVFTVDLPRQPPAPLSIIEGGKQRGVPGAKKTGGAASG